MEPVSGHYSQPEAGGRFIERVDIRLTFSTGAYPTRSVSRKDAFLLRAAAKNNLSNALANLFIHAVFSQLDFICDVWEVLETHRWRCADYISYPKLCDWVEANFEEIFSFYRLPREHHKHMKSTSMLERLNEEIRQRTNVVRTFPNEASCLQLNRSLAVEIHENWIEATPYLNMDLLEDHKHDLLRAFAG